MKETGLMFKAPLVRSILDGSKTQTRRIAKDVKHPDLGNVYTPGALVPEREPQHVIDRACPYGGPGDRIYVRETFVQGFKTDPATGNLLQWDEQGDELPMSTWYRATDEIGWSDDDGWETDAPWLSSARMPKALARIWLDITSVRVERLQQISDADCWAEGAIATAAPGQFSPYSVMGVDGKVYLSPRDAFSELWESTGGDWAANPWCWVIDFKRIHDHKATP